MPVKMKKQIRECYMDVLLESNFSDLGITVWHLLYYVRHAAEIPKLLMGCALSRIRTSLSITQLVDNLNPSLITGLPALYAFTGTDVTSSFTNNEKIKALKLAMNYHEHIDVFSQIARNAGDIVRFVEIIENLVCALYRTSKLISVTDALFARSALG